MCLKCFGMIPACSMSLVCSELSAQKQDLWQQLIRKNIKYRYCRYKKMRERLVAYCNGEEVSSSEDESEEVSSSEDEGRQSSGECMHQALGLDWSMIYV